MHDADLIRMTRQIAAFYEPYPEAEAVAGIATHLRSFWDPAMRAQLDALAETDPDRFAARVLAAVRSLRAPT